MSNIHTIFPVVLCGGSGSRLWPLSREYYPKPFIKLHDGGNLLKNTLYRAAKLPNLGEILIVCNEKHRFFTLEALSQCQLTAKIILEPVPKNTAPSAALAAFDLQDREDALMLVMPADHLFSNPAVFLSAIEPSAAIAMDDFMVTFGIKPSSAETGYGYIKVGHEIADSCYRVERFIEKPDKTRAISMLEKGGYLWNAGIFLMKPQNYLKALETFSPEIYRCCRSAHQASHAEQFFTRPGKEEFLTCPDDSIDYAVMEQAGNLAVMALGSGWSDLGSWEAMYQAASRDDHGNVCIGDALIEDTSNCYLHSEDRLLAVVGLNNLVVVESRDAVLVMPRDRTQDVKKIVATLKRQERPEYLQHPLVRRPWGSYELLANGNRFQVKRIVVKPGASLSLQLHHHRSEHWVVVSGTAEVTVGSRKLYLTENQSVYIAVGNRHKLSNPGIIPLELIEVQSGSYLGEDDIVRLEDMYGRK